MAGLYVVVAGTFGNALTIAAYLKFKSMQTSFNKLIFNLALIDLFSAIGMIPFNIAGYCAMEWFVIVIY